MNILDATTEYKVCSKTFEFTASAALRGNCSLFCCSKGYPWSV